MPSLQARFYNLVIRSLNAKKMFNHLEAAQNDPAQFQAVVTNSRAQGDQAAPDAKLLKRVAHQEKAINGFPLHILQKKQSGKIILFLHGGAYIVGPAAMHWPLLERVMEATGFETAVFNYPKAPEHTATEAIAQTEACYDTLVAQYGAENIVLMGDSAGGGLCVALAMHLRDAGKPLPSRLLLLYPWLDVTMPKSESEKLEAKDLLLTCAGLRACGEAYAGELANSDPLVSPFYGSLDGLPPMHIFSGTHDVLFPQGEAFHQKAQAAGHNSTFHRYDKMQHAWMMFPTPEAKQAIRELAQLVA